MTSDHISSRISELCKYIEDLKIQITRDPVKAGEVLSEAQRRLQAIQREISASEERFRQQNKMREEAKERLRTALDFTWDWETWLFPKVRREYVSPSCERITGCSADESLRDPMLIRKIIHHDGRYMGRCARNRGITRRRLAEEAALRAKEDWEQTFAAVPDLICIIDNDFRIVRANKAMATRLCTTTEAIAGLKCYEAVHGTTEPPAFCPHRLMIEDGLEHMIEVHEDRLGGDYIVSVSPLVNAEGKVVGSAHVARDITEHKQALEALQQANERLDMAQKSADAGTWDMNTETGVIAWSPKVFEIFGLDQEKTVPSIETWNALLHPEDRKMANSQIGQALKERTCLDIEYRIIRPGGEIRWISIQGKAVYQDPGRSIRMIGICTDITQRKRIEQSLRDSEQHLRLASQGAYLGTYTYDFRSREGKWSPELKALLGLSPDDPIVLDEHFVYAGLHQADRPAFLAAINAANDPSGDGNLHMEFRVVIPDGSIRWLEARGHTDFIVEGKDCRPLRIAGVVVDITKRKLAEEALKRSESKYRLLHSSMTDAFASVNMEGGITEYNRSFCSMIGYEPDEITNLTYRDLTPDIWYSFEERIIREEVLSRGYSSIYEKEYRRKDGTIFPVELRTFLLRDEAGNATGMWAIVRDISERKLLEKMLTQERDKAKNLLDIVEVIILALDTRGKITLINKKAREILECRKEEIVGVDWIETFIPEGVRDDLRACFDKLALGELESVERIENPIITNRGEERIISWHNSVIRDEDGKIIGTLSSGMDITERKRTEEQLKQYSEHLEELVDERTRQLKDAERLATIGETALMIGHDLRNPLQAIVNTTYLAKSKLERISLNKESTSMNHAFLEDLRTIDRQSEYMNKIVSDLQDYARPLRPEMVEVSLKSFVVDALAGIRIPEDVDVQMEIDGQLSWKVDPTMMVRVLVNLVTNALQAMPDGGRLIIAAISAKDSRVLNINDDGVGIPPDIMPRVFDPLFTTKSRGMGMGLIVARRMVEAQGGSLDINSNIGKGTTATIRMPYSPEAVSNTGKNVTMP